MKEPNYFIPDRSFSVFGFEIYYYAVCIVCGIILATVVCALLFRRRNIPTDWVIDLLLCILPLGIIGARTFYCLTDPTTSMADWFSKFREGGLSIIGGVCGGALGVVLFCLIHKINFLRVADCLLPCVILAQAVGRWGNFFNQEVYGAEITNTAMQWFPFGVYIERSSTWHYAFFFYESLLDLIIFALLFTLMWKFTKKPHGLATAGYFFGYGVVRSVMEPLRDAQYILGETVAVSQLFAMGMAIGGLLLFVAVLYFNRVKYGSCFGAVTGEPLATMPKYYTKEQLKKLEDEKAKKMAAAQEASQEKPQEPSKPKKHVIKCSECGAKFAAEEGIAECPFCHALTECPAEDKKEERHGEEK